MDKYIQHTVLKSCRYKTLVFIHSSEQVPFHFHGKIAWWWWEGGRGGSGINLAYVWSAGGHSWTSCFTIPESISQRYYRDLSGLPHISHSVLSVEGMMSGTANKVCVKSLNKAWNWQDAWPSEAPARHRLWRQTGTDAHLQTARLPFGLPIKIRRRSASTLLMQKMTSFISHYEERVFKNVATQKRPVVLSASCTEEFAYIGGREGWKIPPIFRCSVMVVSQDGARKRSQQFISLYVSF